MTTPTRNPFGPPGGIPIQQASQLLGIPQPTLRSWESRYGFPPMSRSAGGHRRYSEEGLNQLRLMRDEIARGSRAGDAATSVRMMLDPGDPFLARITEFLSAAKDGDATMLRGVLDRGLDDLGLGVTIDGVLMPAMRQVGVWWQTGQCDVAQEHFATETARGWLSRVTTTTPEVDHESPYLLACGPGDLHTIGLEGLAALLAEAGFGSRILAARTSELTIVSAAATSSAAGVVIVSHLASRRRSTIAALKSVATCGFPMFYAGNAFAFPADRAGVPGTYLGENLTQAAQIVLGSSRAGSGEKP